MSKILEKSLKDARKENRLTMGSKEVLNSVNNSKLMSRTAPAPLRGGETIFRKCTNGIEK